MKIPETLEEGICDSILKSFNGTKATGVSSVGDSGFRRCFVFFVVVVVQIVALYFIKKYLCV